MSGFTEDEKQQLYLVRKIIERREKEYKEQPNTMLGHWAIARMFRDVQELLFQLEYTSIRSKEKSE